MINTSSYIVSNINSVPKQKKLLLTIFVLPLVSDTVFWGWVPCIHDEWQHHWHLCHHQPSSRAMRLILDLSKLNLGQIHTCFSNINFWIVKTKSFPIIIPVCLPTIELNSIRWLFKVQRLSFSGGEWMYTMLTEVYGQRFWVDQPSQTKLIFKFIFWIDMNKWMEKIKWRTHLDQLNCNIFEFVNFGVHYVCHACFLQNRLILDFRV